MRDFDTGTSPSSRSLEIPQSQGWCTLTCEECGEDYKTLRILADVGRDLCHDCQDPGPLKVGRSSLVGGNDCVKQAFDRPLMENGPLSLGRGGSR